MKVLIINGSPRIDGNSKIAINEFIKEIEKENIETEVIEVGQETIKGCVMCLSCKETGKCVYDDIVNKVVPKLIEADGLLVATPVYYSGANATVLAFLQRLFYSTGKIDKTMKVGAGIACARRAGTTATFDELNKFFLNANMPVVPSTYWNVIHGSYNKDSFKDEEGMQTVRNLAKNMAFLIKTIKLGKEKYGLPNYERGKRTDFIR